MWFSTSTNWIFKLSHMSLTFGFTHPVSVELLPFAVVAARLRMAEQENSLYCPTLCLCFLSLLLSICRMSSSSTSSPFGDEHNKVPPASVCLQCGSFGILRFCINICLHQWSYCTEGEAEGKEEFAPISACAIVFSS